MKKSTIFKGLALSLAATNIAVPYLKKLLDLESDGAIHQMTSEFSEDIRTDLAYYILPGIVCPPYQEYNQFLYGDNSAHQMQARCFFVDYGKDHYDPKKIAKLIAGHIKRHTSLTEVRLLSISIGDQITPYLAKELKDTGVRCRVWTIDPCVEPNSLWYHVRRSLQKGMPFAIAFKVIAGWLGQQRIIPWDCEMRSYAEICEQAEAIAYGNYAYTKADLELNNASLEGVVASMDNEFINMDHVIYGLGTYRFVRHRGLSGLKHCRFSENWQAYISALAELGFYD